MAKTDYLKRMDFYKSVHWMLRDYIQDHINDDKMVAAMSFFKDTYNSFSSSEVLIKSQNSIDSIDAIKKKIADLSNLVQCHIDIGKDLIFDDRSLELHQNKMAKPVEFLSQLDEFEKWCDQSKSKLAQRKRGRMPDNEGVYLIMVIDYNHFQVFKKDGADTIGGYFFKTVRAYLRKTGIVLSDEGIQKKIIATRKKLREYAGKKGYLSIEDRFKGMNDIFSEPY